MKTIKLSPKKLDAAADEYFDTVSYHERNPNLPVPSDYLERSTLAGLALRKWAQEMREDRKRKRKAKTPAKRMPPCYYCGIRPARGGCRRGSAICQECYDSYP